jgi:hypothetical protein
VFPANTTQIRRKRTPLLAPGGLIPAYIRAIPIFVPINRLMYNDDEQACDWIRFADGRLISLHSVFFVLFVTFVDNAFNHVHA